MRILLIVLLSLVSVAKSFSMQEGTVNELNFVEYYSEHQEMLDPQAPFAYSKESFVQHHNALVEVIAEFEKSKPYESREASDKFVTTIKSFWSLILPVYASETNDVCFYGGWPSKLSNGKCQAPWKKAPWKNANDESLKEFGAVYDSNHRCGASDKFRCNPTLFGPGDSGKGVCITFSSIDEISEKCEIESRTEIDKIYDRFSKDEDFRKRYLFLVNSMKSFCVSHAQYKACSVLNVQINNVAIKACGGEIDSTQLNNSRPAQRLSRDVSRVTRSIEQKPKPSQNKKEEVAKPQKVNVENGKLCTLFKKFVDQGVPREPLMQALTFYQNQQYRFQNQRYISIGDYSQSSTNERFYLLDLTSGLVSTEKVSHGSGKNSQGDRDHNGMIDRCVNSDGSRQNMTRPGFYATGDLDFSDHLARTGTPSFMPGKNKLTLYGLSTTNSDAEGAGVVMHEATYNHSGNEVMGRSYGCPAFVPGRGGPVMKKIFGGSLFYSYAPTCANEMRRALSDSRVKNWEDLCH